jgi:hypothetical protein
MPQRKGPNLDGVVISALGWEINGEIGNEDGMEMGMDDATFCPIPNGHSRMNEGELVAAVGSGGGFCV